MATVASIAAWKRSRDRRSMDKDRVPFFSNPFVARAARWGLVAWSLIGILILLYAISRYVLRPIEISSSTSWLACQKKR